MAKIFAMPNSEEWEQKKGETFDNYLAREQKMFDALIAKSDGLGEGDYVGALISTQSGDGAAIYLVHSLKPLQLCHVPYCDAWRADPVWERGLRAADVKRLVDRSRRIRSALTNT